MSVFLLCPFSVKMSIYFTLEILFSTYFVWKKTFEYSHCDMWCYVWIWLYLYICYWCFPKDFEIIRVITSVGDSYIKKIELLVLIFKFNRVLNSWILTVQNVLNRSIVNLYPSVPLDRSIQVIVEFLLDDHAELKKRTKLNLRIFNNS